MTEAIGASVANRTDYGLAATLHSQEWLCQ